MLNLATKSPGILPVITNLFDVLHQDEILYCHWKANEHHLIASMNGDSDLDVLFDERQEHKLELILQRLNFKRFVAIKQKQQEGVVDYITFDRQSGKLIHLHAHYKLLMGQPYLKEYHAGLEGPILRSRVFNDVYGIYCISPAFQLILLYFMESLKIRYRDILLMHFKPKVYRSEKIVREYNWLKSRTDDLEIHNILKTIFRDHRAIHKLVTGEFSPKQAYKLTSILKKELKARRRYSAMEGLIVRLYRETSILISKVLARILAWPIPLRRINPRGGVSVAFAGDDIPNKSAVVAGLKETFEKKIDVYVLSDNKSSLGQWVLQLLKPLRILNNGKSLSHEAHDFNPKASFRRTIYKCIEAFVVAKEKIDNLRSMQTVKGKGALVIYDCFPHNEINDSPKSRLSNLITSRNAVLSTFARMEAKIYAKAKNYTPDILFRLTGGADKSEIKKTGDILNEKSNGVDHTIIQSETGQRCKIIVVDATKPLKEIIFAIRQAVWKLL